jgi:uncharacterized protein YcbK (DUF882 family)
MKLFFLKILVILTLLVLGIFLLYFNNTSLVNKQTTRFYQQLKDTLHRRGYKTNLLVISAKRFKWHNAIQVKLSGAAPKSRHVTNEAIDFLVFDVNSDGSSDSKDVDLVFNILHKDIVRNKGGVGTYKTEKSFFHKQMIHIDCRGYKARWQ